MYSGFLGIFTKYIKRFYPLQAGLQTPWDDHALQAGDIKAAGPRAVERLRACLYILN